MKLRVFNSLFDEKVFFKLPVKLWKYIVFLFIILRIILMNTLFAIFPMVFIYILLRIFVSKDMKMFELLIRIRTNTIIHRRGKIMKRVIILLIAVSSFAFAGGEISFKKQNEKQRRIENAKLEAIKNNIQTKGNVVIEENIEPENTGSIFEDEEILNPLKKKQQNMKSL